MPCPRVYRLEEDLDANQFVLLMEDITPARVGDQLTGCSVDDESMMVRIDPEMVAAALAAAPREHTLHTRNPERRVDMGGNSVAFVPVGGSPHAIDLDTGKRDATIADYRKALRDVQGNKAQLQGQ